MKKSAPKKKRVLSPKQRAQLKRMHEAMRKKAKKPASKKVVKKAATKRKPKLAPVVPIIPPHELPKTDAPGQTFIPGTEQTFAPGTEPSVLPPVTQTEPAPDVTDAEKLL